MADAQEFLLAFGEFIVLLYYFMLYFQWNHWKNATCLYSALTLAVSLGSSLNRRPGGLGFKQLPRATANVNA